MGSESCDDLKVLTRRNFFSVLAAPAIVRAASLMPVRALSTVDWEGLATIPYLLPGNGIPAGWGPLCDVVRRALVPRLYVQVYKNPPLAYLE